MSLAQAAAGFLRGHLERFRDNVIEGDAHAEPRRNTLTGNLLFGTAAMRLNAHVTAHGTITQNVTAASLPAIQLVDGRLVTSGAALKSYEAMIIGPSR